jgi:Dockerin type I domain
MLEPAAPVRGDFNGNGIVDAADYVVWRKTAGQSGTNLSADVNENGAVDQSDYEIWRAAFGATDNGATDSLAGLSGTAVPEPATAALLLILLAVLMSVISGRRKRYPAACLAMVPKRRR